MLTKLFNAPNKEDICPNCGTACFAIDILCSNCGENLDDLFEELSDPEETNDLFKTISKNLPFLNWLTPLLLILLPLIVSLVTALPIALNMSIIPGRKPLQLIGYVVSSSTFEASIFLIISVVPLFLCTTPLLRAKLGQHLAITLTALFSILSVITLWLGLLTANIMSQDSSSAFFGIEIFILTSAGWVYFVIAGGIILIVLNLMVVIGQKKTAYR